MVKGSGWIELVSAKVPSVSEPVGKITPQTGMAVVVTINLRQTSVSSLTT